MRKLAASVLFACPFDMSLAVHYTSFIDSIASVGLPRTLDTASSANELEPATSISDFARSVRQEELATKDLISVAKTNVRGRQDAAKKATTNESKMIALAALQEAEDVVEKLTKANLALTDLKRASYPSVIGKLLKPSVSTSVTTDQPHTNSTHIATKVVRSKVGVEDSHNSDHQAQKQQKLAPVEAQAQKTIEKALRVVKAKARKLQKAGNKLAKAVSPTKLSGSKHRVGPAVARVKNVAAETLGKIKLVKRKAKAAEKQAVTHKGQTLAKKEAAGAKNVEATTLKMVKVARQAEKDSHARSVTKLAKKQTVETEKLALKAEKAMLKADKKSCACISPDEAMSCSSEWRAEFLAAKNAGSRCINDKVQWCYTTLACQNRAGLRLDVAGKCKVRLASNQDCAFNAESVPQRKQAMSKAEEAESRSVDVIKSAMAAQAAAKQAKKLAWNTDDMAAAENALKSAQVLEMQGKAMLKHAKLSRKEVGKMPEKARESVVQRQVANDRVNKALISTSRTLVRDATNLMKKVADLAPGRMMTPIKSRIAKFVQAFNAVIKKGSGQISRPRGMPLGGERLQDALGKTASITSEALKYGLKVLPPGNQKLQKSIKALITKAKQINSQAKQAQGTQIIAKMHEEDNEARAKNIAKIALAKARQAVKTTSRVKKQSDVDVKDLSTDFKNLPTKATSKARKAIAKTNKVAQRAKALNLEAKKTRLAAKECSSKSKSVSRADATKLRTQAEVLAAKADKLTRTEKAVTRQAAQDNQLVIKKAGKLADEVANQVNEANSEDDELEKRADLHMAASKDVIKLSDNMEDLQLAKLNMAEAQEERATAASNKKAAMEIKEAAHEAMKSRKPQVEVLEGLNTKAKKLERRVASSVGTAKQKYQESQDLLVHAAANKADTAVSKLKKMAEGTKKYSEVAEKLGKAEVKQSPDSSAKISKNVAQARKLKRKAIDESKEANRLELQKNQALADPPCAAAKCEEIARTANRIDEQAEASQREAKQVQRHVKSQAKSVVSKIEPAVHQMPSKLQSK
eukprot:TRINITY_DN60945_c0_g1_i1.p1 TRINITY_DN60945_c0_g1~~TRINITY_DN60945_c0_g1_i1.p1  ORF type:complete len:1034 (-),score=234.07 TRINITY_DN60945_c0_g1_i1:110-3211(-)